jgi:hypothetical protein
MRPLSAPFVVVPPSGARIRTRLRVNVADEQVLVRSVSILAGWPAATSPPAVGSAESCTSKAASGRLVSVL